MLKFYLGLALLWLCLMPPLFTDGRCTAEFDRAYAQIQANSARLSNSVRARDFLHGHGWRASVISHDQCRTSRPRSVTQCTSGAIVLGEMPIENLICRVYRDEAVRVQLDYDDNDGLERMMVDMNPFKSLPIPFFNTQIDWAR